MVESEFIIAGVGIGKFCVIAAYIIHWFRSSLKLQRYLSELVNDLDNSKLLLIESQNLEKEISNICKKYDKAVNNFLPFLIPKGAVEKWKEEYKIDRNDIVLSYLKDKFAEEIIERCNLPLEKVELAEKVYKFVKSENPDYAIISERGAKNLRLLNKLIKYTIRKAIKEDPQLMLRYIDNF